MAIEKITLGEMSNVLDKINNNFYQLPPLIIQGNSPTFKTEAQIIGQKFLNSSTTALYVCNEIQYDNVDNIKNENTIYYWNQVSGKNIYNVIVKNEVPTASSYADGIGQLYINSYNNNLYICSNINNDRSVYTWSLIAKGNIFPIIVSYDGIIENNIAQGIGQLLVNLVTNELYMCIKKEDNDDIWYPINTSGQQILYSSTQLSSNIENDLWFKKNGGILKNIDGETSQITII